MIALLRFLSATTLALFQMKKQVFVLFFYGFAADTATDSEGF